MEPEDMEEMVNSFIVASIIVSVVAFAGLVALGFWVFSRQQKRG